MQTVKIETGFYPTRRRQFFIPWDDLKPNVSFLVPKTCRSGVMSQLYKRGFKACSEAVSKDDPNTRVFIKSVPKNS